jgi:hypothetical protein
MMHYEHFKRYSQSRQRDLLHEVARDRLADLAMGRDRTGSSYHPTIARFGGWLIATGTRLQQRYGLSDLPAGKRAAPLQVSR